MEWQHLLQLYQICRESLPVHFLLKRDQGPVQKADAPRRRETCNICVIWLELTSGMPMIRYPALKLLSKVFLLEERR